MGRKNLIILALGIVIIALITVSPLFKNNEKPPEPNIPNNVDNPCSQFQPMEGEISCSDAIAAVLKNHPGKVEYVKKEQSLYAISLSPLRIEKREVYLLGMALDTPQLLSENNSSNLVEIGVDPYGRGTSKLGKWVVFVRERSD